jgi:iron complex transport system permease protein
MDATIFFVTRMPRIILAALAGAGLALAGAALQALLRNPLADPFTLGVASGGALGAVIAIKLGLAITILGLSTLPIFSFAGAIGAVGIVYLLARSRSALPSSVLLLSGVTMSFFFSALILAIHYFADFTESHRMIRWMMGGLDVIGYRALLSILPIWLIGAAVLLLKSRELNLMTFGEYLAQARGVDVGRAQRTCYIAASLLTGGVVALAGPIGFVGLIVPHTLRLIIGPDYRLLMPASLFAGAGFLIICDTIARTVLAPIEMPVGILTAAIGGPFFLGLLFRWKR